MIRTYFKSRRIFALRYRQRGSTLLMSLLFLLVLTVLGIASVSTTGIQERMAHNIREQNIALQSAEAAINDAEHWLESFRTVGPPAVITVGTANCSTIAAVWDDDTAALSPATIRDKDYAWWQSNGCQHGQNAAGADVRDFEILGNEDSGTNQQPYFLIEQTDFIEEGVSFDDKEGQKFTNSLTMGISTNSADPRVYRIYAYAVGQSGNTDILIETHYAISTWAY